MSLSIIITALAALPAVERGSFVLSCSTETIVALFEGGHLRKGDLVGFETRRGSGKPISRGRFAALEPIHKALQQPKARKRTAAQKGQQARDIAWATRTIEHLASPKARVFTKTQAAMLNRALIRDFEQVTADQHEAMALIKRRIANGGPEDTLKELLHTVESLAFG